MSNEKVTSPEQRYFHLPLCWLQKIPENPKGAITNAICYGVLYYAKRIQYRNKEDVARQVISDYFKDKDKMNRDLWIQIKKAGVQKAQPFEVKTIEDLGSKLGDVVSSIVRILEEDLKFQKRCLLHYNLNRACEYYGYDANPALIQSHAKPVIEFQKEQEELFGKQPITKMDHDVVKRFIEEPKDIELLCAHIGIKSLMGHMSWARTTKIAILSRMLGSKHKKALDYLLANDNKAKAVYDGYVNSEGIIKRLQFQKLIHRLLDQGLLKSYFGQGRFIYLSFTLEMKELAITVKQWKSAMIHMNAEQEARKIIRGESSTQTSI